MKEVQLEIMGEERELQYLMNGQKPATKKVMESGVASEFGVAILGTGNYGRALASRLHSLGVNFTLGSRKACVRKFPSGEQKVTTYEEAISCSSIVILAVPRHAYEGLVSSLGNQLKGKTVVDVSNLTKASDPSNALYLQSLLPHSDVMKALNTISAYSLENGGYGASLDTYVCGDDTTKKNQLMQVLREMGLNPIDRGPLQSAPAVEHMPFRFYENWGTALIITLMTLIPILFYYYLRFFWANAHNVAKEKDHLPLYHSQRVIAWLALWLLALTYLPGCLAGYIQIFWGTKYRTFPRWMDRWLKCRKQLGLIVMMLAAMHGCMCCLLMGSGDLKYTMNKYKVPTADGSMLLVKQHLGVKNETSMLFAVIAMTLLVVLGITSLPSVGASMSWKEWNFMHRGVGFFTLIFAFLHVTVYVYKVYTYPMHIWKEGMVPGAFLMPLLPGLVIVLKLGLLLPGLVCYLDRIQGGKVGNQKYDVTEEV